jgi:phage N-6-adenine-methyltransferase
MNTMTDTDVTRSQFWSGPGFSSATDLWSTPQSFFDSCNRIFHFDCDVCALPSSTKCAKYFTPEDDGLKQEWTGTCWTNPPYGRDIGKWMRKAWKSSEQGATVVCLVPARTDTRWWHDYATKGEVLLLRGRLKFGDAETSAPFPSALVVFGKTFGTKYYKQCVACDGIFSAARSHAEVCSNRCQVHRERRAAA